ncbi:hypothetical protein KTH44_15970 [Acinetobacter bereziniae]|uniref:hypothetical protein n=1 Tax=Acinetobacter bereziniae TaxID=106648 RepID=UPI0021CD983A|nr:hypothetical protein [Acinetobacter bereziniae]MCU4320614.1 hypothetical protein [Acinetobacter bereziniae]
MIILGVILIFCGAIGVLMPNWMFDTGSCKRNWIAICIILCGGGLVIDSTNIALFFISSLIIGIFINYAFPMLLNIWEVFNRKSDP